MKKNKILAIVLLSLVALNGSLLLLDRSGSRQEENKQFFSIKEPDEIGTIVLNGKRDTSFFKIDEDGTWLLNDSFNVDQNLKEILLNVLAGIQVKRPIAKISQQEVFKACQINGVEVKVTDGNGEVLQNFYAHGNASHTRSYFADSKTQKVYVVEIPGYKNYISGLFALIPSQWRDRMLFSTNPFSLVEISVDFLNEPEKSFRITPGNQFPKVEGLEANDTSKVMNYLDQYNYFQSNEIIPSGLFPRYDSLVNTRPIAQITVKDLGGETNNVVRIFPKLPGEGIQLLLDERGDMSVIEAKRLEKLLVNKLTFNP